MPKDIPASTRDDASKLLSYWRASVSDSMFGKGRFRMTELRRNARLSSHTMEAGRLPPRQTQAIFEGLGSGPINLVEVVRSA